MQVPTEQLKNDLRKTLDDLTRLRDEIRVDLHLAGMEAKDRWNRELEPKLFELEKRLAGEVSDASRLAVAELRTAYEKFRASIRK